MSDPHMLYNTLNEIFLILDDGDRRFFSNYELSPSRYYALFHLLEQPGISFSELSNLMLCDKSNITRIIKGLESDELVVRRPHETDGRTLRLFLSEKGKMLCKKAMVAHRDYNQERFSDLEDIKKDNLLEGLQQLKSSLRSRLDVDL
ncbi:MAG: MarR family transcriptional regulator [Candidatus Promineifilaceae bacterium]